jgi:hypothetical protein
MKKIFSAFLIIAIITLTGCNFLNPEDYMKAPKSQGIYADVEKALKDAVGSNIILKFPRMGENLSAFISLNETVTEEKIIAVYTKNDNQNPVIHLNLLKRQDDEWVSTDDIETSITEIDMMSTENFDNDGDKELLLYYVSPLSFASAVTVVSVKNNKLKFELGESCTKYVTYDVDEDGDKELLLLSLDTVKRESYAKLYDYKVDKMIEKSNTRLDGNVSFYDDIKIQNNDGNIIFFADGTKNSEDPNGSQTAITEVICFKEEKLYAPFTENDDHTNYETFRNKPLKVEDFDKDGIYEIPLINYTSDDVYLTEYFTFDYENKNLKIKSTVYTNNTDGYYLLLDNIEIPKSVDIEEEPGRTVFSAKGKIGFTIITVSESDYEKYNDYDLLQMTADKIYLVKTENEVTFDEVKQAFNLKEEL